jgi:hypothetical protein
MAEARIQMKCEGCGKTVTFPAADLGTVQECPDCGGYLDVPELTRVPTVYDQQTDAYTRQSEETERQLRRSGEQQEETERQLRLTGQQQEQTQRQLDQRDRLAALEEQLLDRVIRLLDRWEALATRADQALSDLEKRGRP